MRIDIRPSNKRDLSVVLSIENKVYTKPWSREELQEYDQDKTKMRDVALLDGLVVGYICYSIKSTYFLIDSITVAPEYQDKGVGSLLLDHVKELLNKKYTKITAYTVADQEKTENFFIQNGFYEVQEYHSNAQGQKLKKFTFFNFRYTSIATKNRISQYFKSTR